MSEPQEPCTEICAEFARMIGELTAGEQASISRIWIEMRSQTPQIDRTKESHDPILAMKQSPLEPEEIYFLIRFAERLGYTKAINRLRPGYPLRVWRRWLIWIGGWETPDLMQWDCGKPAWNIWRDHIEWKPDEPIWKAYLRRLTAFDSPTPISFFGHLFSIGSFGFTLGLEHLRAGWGYFCLTKDNIYNPFSKFYWSPNGTPSHERARIFWRRKPKPRPWEND